MLSLLPSVQAVHAVGDEAHIDDEPEALLEPRGTEQGNNESTEDLLVSAGSGQFNSVQGVLLPGKIVQRVSTNTKISVMLVVMFDDPG